jgi:murein DD-endopeptidase MepM/ murein hydrolase activator NlpD
MRKHIILLFIILTASGCASTPYITKPVPPPPGLPGTYHHVERGQTLWRISKIYDADLDEIARINRISDATSIEIGQYIFIPHAAKKEVKRLGYSNDDFIWPVRGRVIASFGQSFGNMVNKGINIQPYGNADILASRGGVVVFYSDAFGSFGKTIIIDHGDGFSTVYARNAQVFIKAGDQVQRGAIIAKAGSSGRDKNTYLHFQIRKGHLPQNPYYYLP